MENEREKIKQSQMHSPAKKSRRLGKGLSALGLPIETPIAARQPIDLVVQYAIWWEGVREDSRL